MRTTLNIDEDVLLAAKQLARDQGVPVGNVLSALARQALTRSVNTASRNGLPLFPVQPNAGVVTRDLVNQLRDDRP